MTNLIEHQPNHNHILIHLPNTHIHIPKLRLLTPSASWMIFVIAYWMKEEDLKERFEGKLYDRYEVLEVIGSGTFGKVYLVRSS
jgi:hypothetical protein